jgi:hypothetical protein
VVNAVSLRPYIAAGIAATGAGFWLAHGGQAPTEPPAVQLTSVESSCTDPL